MSDHHGTHRAYFALTALFNTALATVATTNKAKRRLSGSIPWADLTLMAFAAHKIARLLTRDRVTETIREPFTESPDGKHEKPAGHGARRAIGELLTCPYCTTPWVSLGLMAGHIFAPVPTRVVTGVFTVVGVSDFVNRVYSRLEGPPARHLLAPTSAQTTGS